MLFNSLQFVLFMLVVFPAYWLAHKNRQLQNVLLLAASYVFYGWWDWRFLFLIAASTVVDFICGLRIEQTSQPRVRKQWLWLSMVFNLGVLLCFKYFNFFIENFERMVGAMGFEVSTWTLQIILPVGISFYTFQTMSYSLDVYRGSMKATRDPLAFAAYVGFFPQLVAGPIERASRLLPQFDVDRRFNMDRAKDGLRQIVWGLFTKMVIADNCAPLVNEIFSQDPSTLSGATLMMGAVFFAFQIYGDFSGYSNIALGVSKLFGFELMINFKTPYFSRDIAEFWRRWHVSLSTWFRDYLYIPLGGSKGSKGKALRNIFIIFLVSGFWHGANWTFVVWGGLNALFFLPLFLGGRNRRYTENVAEGRWFPSFSEALRMLVTFGLTCFAWIFFRADSLSGALSYCKHLVLNIADHPGSILNWLGETVIFFILVLLVFEWIFRGKEHGLSLEKQKVWLRWPLYYGILGAILFFGNYQEKIDFIYFQF